MSAIDSESLKSASDTLISFQERTENFTLAQLRHDTLLEFGKLCKILKIVNNDGLNPLTYRTISPSSTPRTVPPNSEDTLEEWTSYIEINPNAGTGNGTIEMDLVDPKGARK